MTVSTSCKGCGVELQADNEEQLVDEVQARLAQTHAGGHEPSRDQVRRVIRGRDDDHP